MSPTGRRLGHRGGWACWAAAGLLLVGCGIVAASADPVALAGPDLDGDGVRDDVGDAIRGLDVRPAMRAYLVATARVEQRIMLLDPSADGARDTAYDIAQQANRLISCVPAPLDAADAWQQADTVQALVENTSARRAQVSRFTDLIDGRDFVEPAC